MCIYKCRVLFRDLMDLEVGATFPILSDTAEIPFATCDCIAFPPPLSGIADTFSSCLGASFAPISSEPDIYTFRNGSHRDDMVGRLRRDISIAKPYISMSSVADSSRNRYKSG